MVSFHKLGKQRPRTNYTINSLESYRPLKFFKPELHPELIPVVVESHSRIW